MSEPLDLTNIIEIDKIRELLIDYPDLLSIFEILIIISNNRINKETIVDIIPMEHYIEPNLSDHESDEDI